MVRKDLTIAIILQELADEFDGIVAEREVFDRVLARRSSSAKNPYTSIREQIRSDGPNNGWIALGKGELIPFHTALSGARFRVIPSNDDLIRGSIPLQAFRPFVPVRVAALRIVDQHGALLTAELVDQAYIDPLFGSVNRSAMVVPDWFAQTGFQPGDSILATVVGFAPLTIQLDHERAADFQAEAVAERDQAFIDAIAELVAKTKHHSVYIDNTVLPIFVQATWRTAYPGMPWYSLAERDPRLRIIMGDMLAHSSFRTPFERMTEEIEREHNQDELLFEQITVLQEQLLDSRRDAVERGLWDGTVPRVSTAQTLFDFEAGTSTTIYPGAVNALEDHTATIEEHIANGDYEEDWSIDDDVLGIEVEEDLDGLDSVDTIDDVQTFVEENPEIAAATRRLMESLTPNEQQRLDKARSIDDVQQVLGPHLAELLRTEPALFVPLTPDMYEFTGDSHGTNGNGHTSELGLDLLASDDWEDEPTGLEANEDWLLAGDDDDSDDSGPEFGDEAVMTAAVERSSELLDQFVEQQMNTGKAKSTATSRAGDLWLYADFLSRYYGRSLELGDYATLDECLFFFYPRKVLDSSPRNAREFCTSAKQFYAFLKAEKLVASDAFALAMWQRRDQAARVVELYDQIDSESPQFDRLFAHLFAPYTA